MNLYDLTVPQLQKTLRNVDAWLVAATAHADAKKFSIDSLLTARLAPDQFALVRQIQTVCDNAKFIAGRLTGKQWPVHADEETTMEQLRARIATVLAHLDTYKPEDFSGGEARQISLPWMGGKYMLGDEYLIQFALPNFYFHVVTTYSILRHNGVDLGKTAFIGGVPMRG